MDNKKFGAYLAELRRGKNWTQRELAERIHVTDKAVSKWERGLGFPDIHTLEPLADALGVSMLELMHSEPIPDEVASEDASKALEDVLGAACWQRRLERRNTVIVLVSVLTLVLLVFLVDAMGWYGFVGVCLPIILLLAGIIFMFAGYRSFRRKRGWISLTVIGLVAVSIPVVALVLFAFAFLWGGPVPN